MIHLSVEQAWAIFLAGCSGLALFAWLVWWLAAQFTSIRSLIHDKHNKLDKRISHLEWQAGVVRHWNAPDDDTRS